MAKIYISSTYKDLQKEREAAAKAVRRLGHQAIAMEDYVACDERPVDRCVSDAGTCDIYVGIFTRQRGTGGRGYLIANIFAGVIDNSLIMMHINKWKIFHGV